MKELQCEEARSGGGEEEEGAESYLKIYQPSPGRWGITVEIEMIIKLIVIHIYI